MSAAAQPLREGDGEGEGEGDRMLDCLKRMRTHTRRRALAGVSECRVTRDCCLILAPPADPTVAGSSLITLPWHVRPGKWRCRRRRRRARARPPATGDNSDNSDNTPHILKERDEAREAGELHYLIKVIRDSTRVLVSRVLVSRVLGSRGGDLGASADLRDFAFAARRDDAEPELIRAITVKKGSRARDNRQYRPRVRCRRGARFRDANFLDQHSQLLRGKSDKNIHKFEYMRKN
jgi:hypothetical protein